MKTEGLIKIFCQLTSTFDVHETEQSVFVYVFSSRKYEVLVKRIDGKIINFAVKDIGEFVKDKEAVA